MSIGTFVRPGDILVGKVIEAAREDNRKYLLVHGLVESKAFYSKLGFVESSQMYESGDKKVMVQKMSLPIMKSE